LTCKFINRIRFDCDERDGMCVDLNIFMLHVCDGY